MQMKEIFVLLIYNTFFSSKIHNNEKHSRKKIEINKIGTCFYACRFTFMLNKKHLLAINLTLLLYDQQVCSLCL